MEKHQTHKLHAYSHKRMFDDMAIKISGVYSFLEGSRVVTFLSREDAKVLMEELRGIVGDE